MFFDKEFIQKHGSILNHKILKKDLDRISASKSNFRFRNKLNIKIKANNIFCSFSEIYDSKNKNIESASTGIYKIKTTKKSIEYTYAKMIKVFITKIYRKLKNIDEEKDVDFDPFDFTILNIVAQKPLHEPIINIFKAYGRIRKKSIKRKFAKPFLFINLEPKKCFNGCRASKKRRKKRLKDVIFK